MAAKSLPEEEWLGFPTDAGGPSREVLGFPWRRHGDAY